MDRDAFICVRRNLVAILRRRGYDVASLEGESPLEIAEMIRNRDRAMDFHVSAPGGAICYVHFNEELRSTIQQAYINGIVKTYATLRPEDTLLIVTVNKVNETSQDTLRGIWASRGLYVQIFTTRELMVDKTKSIYMPEHAEATDAEVDALLVKHAIGSKDDLANVLPSLDRDDVAVALAGIRPGKVCRIARNSEVAGTAVVYKYVKNYLPTSKGIGTKGWTTVSATPDE